MQKTSHTSTPRPARRHVVWGAVIAASTGLASTVGCQGQEPVAPGDSVIGPFAGSSNATVGGSAGRAASGGASGSAGSAVTAGGSAGSTSGASGSGALPSGGVGGASAVGGSGGLSAGAPAVGGASSGSAGSGGVGSGGVSSGGGAGTGGVGYAGMSGSGMAGKPCVDVEPPPDPEWPGAVCENWATETEECSAEWFANYCDVSCGRCVPEGGSPNQPAVDCTQAGLPAVSGGNGYATRYWDCCQTHCSQFDGHRCGQDGVSSTGDTNSSCNGGGSYACYDQTPHAVNDCLSYGYIAKANPNCGGCYRIQFTGEGQYAVDIGSTMIKGKQMIVKVSNTGGDVASNQFDMMIPGGGVGQFNACSKEWGTSDLGAQYGGFLTNCTGTHDAKKECVRAGCMKIPAGKARDGCLWFVDWFEVADNPKFVSQATDCPF